MATTTMSSASVTLSGSSSQLSTVATGGIRDKPGALRATNTIAEEDSSSGGIDALYIADHRSSPAQTGQRDSSQL